MYIRAVLSSSGLCSSHFLWWMSGTQTTLSQKTVMKFGAVMNASVVFWKMWPNLLAQKCTCSNSNIWLNVFSPPNILLLIVTRQLNFCFIQKGFPLSVWSAANFSHALRCVWSKKVSGARLNTVICLPAASNSSQTYFLLFFGWLLTILTSFLSAAGDSLCFLIMAVTQTVLSTLYL